jgi:hypothetical protein
MHADTKHHKVDDLLPYGANGTLKRFHVYSNFAVNVPVQHLLHYYIVWLSGTHIALNKTMTRLLPKQAVRNKIGTTEIAQHAFTEYTLKHKN